jgi:ABC-type transport system involved in multi-copper enzyme maturation permease subunit
MNTILTITRLTFHEAWRRRMVLIALAMGAVFILLYTIGFGLITGEIGREGTPAFLMPAAYNMLLMTGLYVVHFLAVMLAIFASVDVVSGEIASHTIQTIITKPVRRWQVLFGKWLGTAAMLLVYLLILGGGVIGSTFWQVRYLPPNALQGLLLLMLEGLVLISLSMLGGARLSTLTNGVTLFMLYGLAFIGSWVEQIGSVFESEAAVRVGIVTSLIMPVETIWRRAAHLMQPSVAGVDIDNFMTPFGAISVPSPAMVVYAVLYAALALGLAMRSFGRRDL